eukprot:363901-Chlamydomonas_euryale.AAC.37
MMIDVQLWAPLAACACLPGNRPCWNFCPPTFEFLSPFTTPSLCFRLWDSANWRCDMCSVAWACS